ncbi:hypothetical protein DL95DRAFT_490294, partial [Leptodontidium sp. 2 PMI_412]
LVPVELAVEELIEDYDRRRGKHAVPKPVSSQNLIRRREQNRISQRTFREKRAQQVAELEEKLRSLEENYNELLRSHEALQLEVNAAMKLLGGNTKEKSEEDRSERHIGNVDSQPGEEAKF